MAEHKDSLADSVYKIGNALEDLRASGLNEKAIVVLLHHKTNLGMRTIKRVLDGLNTMKKDYCS